MKNTLKHASILFGYKLLFALLALVFLASFDYLGLKVYSYITAALYLAAAYSYIWKIGKKDSKEKFNIKNAFYPIIIVEAVTLIFILLEIFVPSPVTGAILRIYQAAYLWFISDNLSKFLLIIPIFIIGTVSYFLGYKKIEIYDGIIMKLVYKNRKR